MKASFKTNITLAMFIALATLLQKEVFANYDIGVAAYSYTVGVISVYLYYSLSKNFKSNVKRSRS